MQTGTHRGTSAAINVTPLIDVLLVLLIIFMVIQPAIVHGLPSLVPQGTGKGEGRPIVLSVGMRKGELHYLLDGSEIAGGELVANLRTALGRSTEPLLLIDGQPDLDYEAVAAAVDTAKAAGATEIVLRVKPS